MANVTGKVFITVNGKRLASKAGAKLNFASEEGEMVMAESGPVGARYTPVAPGFECTIIHTDETSMTELGAIRAGAASFDTDSGKSYVLSGVYYLKGNELSGGEVSYTFGALDCREV